MLCRCSHERFRLDFDMHYWAVRNFRLHNLKSKIS